MKKDFYEILGVSKQSSKEEIKKAFHRLAHKYHPDKKGGDEAKFKELNEAYQTLSDDGKRSRYDNFGAADGAVALAADARGGGGTSRWTCRFLLPKRCLAPLATFSCLRLAFAMSVKVAA